MHATQRTAPWMQAACYDILGGEVGGAAEQRPRITLEGTHNTRIRLQTTPELPSLPLGRTAFREGRAAAKQPSKQSPPS